MKIKIKKKLGEVSSAIGISGAAGGFIADSVAGSPAWRNDSGPRGGSWREDSTHRGSDEKPGADFGRGGHSGTILSAARKPAAGSGKNCADVPDGWP